MSKPNFTLITGIGGPAQAAPEPQTVRVPLSGHSTKTIKKKAPVNPGTLVAEHPSSSVGDAHSPVLGVVADVTDFEVIITPGPAQPAKEGEPAPTADPVEPIGVDALDGDELKKALKGLGVSVRVLPGAPTLIVNAMNPEPGTGIAELLLSQYKGIVEKGLATLQRLVKPGTVYLAAPAGTDAALYGCTTKAISPVYPASVDDLVVKAVTGKERPEGVAVVSVMDLYSIGKVAETGLPLTETILTIGETAYEAKIGTPMEEMLALAGVQPVAGDRVIVGGAMRGEAVASASGGIGKGVYALTVVPQDAFPPVSDQVCINCGECTLVCPSRIMPGFVARYVEFKLYDQAQKFHIGACIECGLCGYVCTARRPLLQFIRMGKKTLELQASALTSCRLQGE